MELVSVLESRLRALEGQREQQIANVNAIAGAITEVKNLLALALNPAKKAVTPEVPKTGEPAKAKKKRGPKPGSKRKNAKQDFVSLPEGDNDIKPISESL